jgi:hypothetical protein
MQNNVKAQRDAVLFVCGCNLLLRTANGSELGQEERLYILKGPNPQQGLPLRRRATFIFTPTSRFDPK